MKGWRSRKVKYEAASGAPRREEGAGRNDRRREAYGADLRCDGSGDVLQSQGQCWSRRAGGETVADGDRMHRGWGALGHGVAQDATRRGCRSLGMRCAGAGDRKSVV